MDTLRQDLRYALRSLRANPVFTVVALATLALGIGVNTAIFSVVNGVILRSLPYPEANQLVTVWENHEKRGGPVQEWTGRSTFADWREQNQSFTHLTAVTGWGPNLTGIDQTEMLVGALISPGYFPVMGIEPIQGRGFLREEEIPGNETVAIISHEFWQNRLGGAGDTLGRALTLNGEPYTVVGILPPRFGGPIIRSAEIWAPLPIDPANDDRGNYFLRVIGRLKPGLAMETAGADMNRVAANIATQAPVDYRDVSINLTPLQDTVVGTVRTPLLVLLGAVGLILLIACANVANLMLARSSVRERELAVRTALGAGRARLIRQLLTESVVLALAGGSFGLLLGVWGTDLLVQIAPASMPRVGEIALHPTVFLFAAAASVLTGILFGLAPAIGLSSAAHTQALRERGQGSTPRGGARLRGALVVVELALGMAVLASAGLLLKSFAELQGVNPGFRVNSALSARLNLPAARYPKGSDITAFLERLEKRLRELPGVTSVGTVTVLPLSGMVHDISFGIEGRLPPPGEAPAADIQRATPGAFKTLGIPLIQGRLLQDSDRKESLKVALVSESLARSHFADENPVGRRIRMGDVQGEDSPWWTIVGVVGSVRSRALDRIPEPEIYVPAAQRSSRGWSLVLRTDREDPHALVPSLREAMRSLDSELALSQVATLEGLFATSIAPQRFLGWLLGSFAALAVILGAVGIYGVMAFMVSRRTREIGIRMALGASPSDVLRAVMQRGLWLTCGGLVLGAAAALAASRAIASLLFQVSPNDPGNLVLAATLLAGTALFACYWPARRATRVDPMVALRDE